MLTPWFWVYRESWSSSWVLSRHSVILLSSAWSLLWAFSARTTSATRSESCSWARRWPLSNSCSFSCCRSSWAEKHTHNPIFHLSKFWIWLTIYALPIKWLGNVCAYTHPHTHTHTHHTHTHNTHTHTHTPHTHTHTTQHSYILYIYNIYIHIHINNPSLSQSHCML